MDRTKRAVDAQAHRSTTTEFVFAYRGVLLMNRKLLASAICASLLVAGAAYAQDNPASTPQAQNQSTTTTQPSTNDNQSPSKKEEPKTLESVTVTGSLLKRPEYQTTSPVQVVNVQADINAGQFTTADFLQT
ncbi:MAG: hypothetical protein KJS83_05555, partial [Xanthomonadaceae bacterium]|nr:hypothetical protein [Xanthomonadaceae bacterium]